MPCILYIETATEACSVVVAKADKIIFERMETIGPSHAVLLGVFVNDAILFLKNENIRLDAVAVSCGPGSYTGLRIGVSEAKGLCYGFDIPLIAIETLKIMAKGIIDKCEIDKNTLLCPMIDARRMEVYDAIFDRNLQPVRATSADIITADSFSDIMESNKIIFFGNGAEKCKGVLQSANSIFVDNIIPRASDMVALGVEAFKKEKFVDTAYFEPFYLKEFVATVAKNKILPD